MATFTNVRLQTEGLVIRGWVAGSETLKNTTRNLPSSLRTENRHLSFPSQRSTSTVRLTGAFTAFQKSGTSISARRRRRSVKLSPVVAGRSVAAAMVDMTDARSAAGRSPAQQSTLALVGKSWDTATMATLAFAHTFCWNFYDSTVGRATSDSLRGSWPRGGRTWAGGGRTWA